LIGPVKKKERGDIRKREDLLVTSRWKESTAHLWSEKTSYRRASRKRKTKKHGSGEENVSVGSGPTGEVNPGKRERKKGH